MEGLRGTLLELNPDYRRHKRKLERKFSEKLWRFYTTTAEVEFTARPHEPAIWSEIVESKDLPLTKRTTTGV